MVAALRFALRSLVKTPGFTAIAITALALGVGANSAIFSLVNQLLLHPPGISNPEKVVVVRAKSDKLNLRSIPLSVPDFADIRASRQIFVHTATMAGGDFNFTGSGVPERLQGASVSVEWFDVFGARPYLGRAFRPEEDQPNADPVVVLAYSTWKRLFGGDPSAVGRTIELNQKPYRIAGVMQPEFRYLMADLWTPLGLNDAAYAEGNRFNENYLTVARLAPGVSLERANAFIQVLSERVRRNGTRGGQYAQDSLWGMFAIPVTDFLAGDTKKPLLVLLGAVGFVLLIACSNIAGLMVARAAGRAKEIAVRTALGAGRWQLVRQVIAESLLLALGGALAGAFTAYAGIHLLLVIAPANAAVPVEPRLDTPVLLFTALMAIVASVLSGLAPAWQVARFDPYEVLKATGQAVTGGLGKQRLRAALVTGEAALAVVLLAGAGLFLRSLSHLEDVRPGFEPRGVMTATLTLPMPRYKEPEKQFAFYRAVIERLAGMRGVETATLGFPLPFSGNGGSSSFTIEGRETGPGDPGPHSDIEYVAPGYFKALQIPLKSGRYLGAEDRQNSEPVTVIDENLARQYWPNENPVGKHIRSGRQSRWVTVVGVVGHVIPSDLAGDTGKGQRYYSLFQQPIPMVSVVVKTNGDAASPRTRDSRSGSGGRS